MREYDILNQLRTWKKDEWKKWIKDTLDGTKDTLVFPNLSNNTNVLVNIFTLLGLENNELSGYHNALLDVLLGKLNKEVKIKKDEEDIETLRGALDFLKKKSFT